MYNCGDAYISHICMYYTYTLIYTSIFVHKSSVWLPSRQVGVFGVVYILYKAICVVIPLLYRCVFLSAPYTKHITGILMLCGIYHNGKRVICPPVSFLIRVLMIYKHIPYIPHAIPSYTCMLACYTIV